MSRGYCKRWGCILPVGEGSEFGPGPVCMVCEQGLRPSPVPPDTVRRKALSALRATAVALDSYCHDHNSTAPTDPSAVLPQVRQAIALIEATDEGEVEG